MTIEIRKAKLEDTGAILEISSQIWDGTDYVPRVLDKWMSGKDGTLWCALLDGQVLGFARSTHLSSSRCWMEGIRVSSKARGLGLGKALAEFQMSEAFTAGFESCCLSSYIENYESLHIVRSHGFEETAQFKIYDWLKVSETEASNEAKSENEPFNANYSENRKALLKNCNIRVVDETEKNQIIEAMATSDMLKRRKGYLSYDWTFETFSREWISMCIDDGDFYAIETPMGSGFFSLSGKHAKGNIKTLNYVSGFNIEEMVLAYCIEKALESGFESFCYMAYNNEKDAQFKNIGLETYNEHNQDVFVFEKKGRE